MAWQQEKSSKTPKKKFAEEKTFLTDLDHVVIKFTNNHAVINFLRANQKSRKTVWRV